MKLADGKIPFGSWQPDLPDLDNPGVTEARNVLPVEGTYKPFLPLSTQGDALPARPLGAAEYRASNAQSFLYAGTSTRLYRQQTSLGTWTDVSSGAYAAVVAWGFALYDTLVIATNYTSAPEKATLGSGSFSTLATTGTAPKAQRIGKIGQFIVLGDTNDATNGVVPHRVQWCAVDDPTNWPTPGTSAALTVQSGEQFLNGEWGPVNAIDGGDQFGLVFQTGGITRMTYNGGSTVFQFDEISGAEGTYLPASVIKHNGLWYYIARSGVRVTDGTRSDLLEKNDVDRYFTVAFQGAERERVSAAMDTSRKVIFWGYSTVLGAAPDKLLILNYEEKRFTNADQSHNVLVSAPLGEPQAAVATRPRAFDTSNVYGDFSGFAGTAIITSPEVEFSPGGRTFVQGVKPLIARASGSVTATVAIGARDSLDSAVTYTSESTPHSRTGFAGFRSDARYHRARTTITGNFDSAMGLEFQQVPSGAV